MGVLKRLPALLLSIAAAAGCGDALIPWPEDQVDPEHPAQERDPPAAFESCTELLAKTDDHACLVVDQYHTVLLFGLETATFCNPYVHLEVDRRGKPSWLGEDLVMCSVHGLYRHSLTTGRHDLSEGTACLNTVELDGALLLQTDRTTLDLYDDFEGARTRGRRASAAMTLAPWPDTLSANSGRLYWSDMARPDGLAWSMFANPAEHGKMPMQNESFITSFEVLAENTVLGLAYAPDDSSSFHRVDLETGVTVEELALQVRLSYPALTDCRPLR